MQTRFLKPYEIFDIFFTWGKRLCLLTISAKLFSILPIGFREDVLSFIYRSIRETGHTPYNQLFRQFKFAFLYIRETGHTLQWPRFCFWKWSPSYHFCQIILNSDQLFQMRKFLELPSLQQVMSIGIYVL